MPVMEDVATRILDHKFIVFGRDGINTLGVIRALGEAGIRPYLVLWTRPELSKYSKYVQECYLSFTLEKGFQYILSKFGEEKEKVWDWCDVLVLPTLSENFGLVVAEALERGKRVITTDGAPAWGDDNDYGGRLIYLKGYRDGTPEERVRLLKTAIEGVCK